MVAVLLTRSPYGNVTGKTAAAVRGRQCEAVSTASKELEVALNQKMKKLIQKLGEAIHETVAESEDIAVVVKNIREQGFDVLLMLEATIGLNEVEKEGETTESEEATAEGFTPSDLSFLKSLRISVEGEDGSEPAESQAPE